MKRRTILKSALAAPIVPGLLPAQTAAPVAPEIAKLTYTDPSAAGEGVPRFFDAAAFAVFSRLGDILMPAASGAPGARETKAAAFLDFLIAESPQETQMLYRNGVARLQQEAGKRGKTFDALSDADAAPILTPLAQAWTYDGPGDPFAQFLAQAKADFFQAVHNSREWSEAFSRTRRGAAGLGTYWNAVE